VHSGMQTRIASLEQGIACPLHHRRGGHPEVMDLRLRREGLQVLKWRHGTGHTMSVGRESVQTLTTAPPQPSARLSPAHPYSDMLTTVCSEPAPTGDDRHRWYRRIQPGERAPKARPTDG